MIDLRFAEHIAAYVDVVRGGSFSSAARRRAVSPSAIVRQIDALEKALGVKLLVRSTRAVSTTDAGVCLFDRAQRLLGDLVDTHAEVLACDGRVAGRLRIACAPSFGKMFVVPALERLMREHPDLVAEIDISERLAEPVVDRLDAIVRVGDLTDSSLIATKLGEQERWLIASAAYLELHDPVQEPADLRKHRLIDKLDATDLLGWKDVIGHASSPGTGDLATFRCNDFEAMRIAARMGMGVAFLPDWLVRADVDSGSLVRLLHGGEGLNLRPQGIYLLRSLSQPSAKVRALIASLKAGFDASAAVPGQNALLGTQFIDEKANTTSARLVFAS